MLKQLTIASLALAAVAAAPAARAQASDLPSVTVSMAGIDANSDSGARIMLQRIKNAAGQVCGGQPSLALDRQQKFDPCVREVTLRTVSGLHNARVTALLNKEAPQTPKAQIASAH